MAYVDFRKLRSQLDMQDVLNLLDWEPTGHDRNGARGPCPVHGSTSMGSRTFSVNLASAMFRCFKCGAQGNALDLYAQVSRLSIHSAAIELMNEFGIDA